MDELHLTRADLESMTTAELVRLADSFGIDIPPGLDRVFVIEELLDLSSFYESFKEDGASLETLNAEPPSAGRGFRGGGAGEAGAETAIEALSYGTGILPILFPAEDPDSEGPLRNAPAAGAREGVFGKEDFPGSVPFPRQYNITFIEVMIRDPLWVFAFWEIKEHDREAFERTAGFEGYRLRIDPRGKIPLGEPPLGENGAADTLSGFAVPINPADTALYIGFPSENRGRRFQVELCAALGERIDVLASSRLFAMPRLQERAGLPGRRFSKLALLSGAEDFPILRNPERKARLRYGRESRQPGE
ncbi:MAG: DUF4912 domain-containing protein [Treponema sp.]|jgi:hypothetical protein|nr:DUF4912 domain-containing protein [Treponema sp.]